MAVGLNGGFGKVSAGPVGRVLDCFSGLYKKADSFFKKGRFEKVCRDPHTYWYPFAILGTNALILIGRYLYSLYWIIPRVVTINPLYIIIFGLSPFIFWAMSTMCEKFDTRGTKRLILNICVINLMLHLTQITWSLMGKFVVKRILLLRIAGSMTPALVADTARQCLIVSVVVPFVIIYRPIRRVLLDDTTVKMISDFKLSRIVDLRTDKDVAYDVQIMKEAEGFGKKAVLRQHDLFTHSLLVGASGVGKTATSINPFIISILDRKCQNRAVRQQLLIDLVNRGKAYVRGPVSRVTEYDILPREGCTDDVDDIYRSYPDAGITCISPNDGIGDAVVKLCGDCDVSVQMVDPEKHYEGSHVVHMGINPFYVPGGLSDIDKTVRIVSNARNFSETLISVNEAAGSGGGDQYFRDLNTSVTSNIAGVVIAYENLMGRQAMLGQVQDCIKDFKLLYPMVIELNRVYGLGLTITNPYEVTDKNGRGGGKSAAPGNVLDANNLGDGEELRKRSVDLSKSGGSSSFDGDEIERIKKGVDSYKRPIINMVRYVNDELFVNGTKMYDQSRGLRNIIDEMLEHPAVYELLNPDGGRVDFERNLSECRVTVVNTAIGTVKQKSSSAIGLFYMLSNADAVTHRYRDNNHPRETQIHFLIVDEASNYLHKVMSQSVNLWRQYRVSCMYAFQTLDQMDANANYRDIKGSLLQVGNIIAYGRMGESEMKTFELLAGEKKVRQYQTSLSMSSLLQAEPNATTSERITDTKEANASKTDLRYKNFKEATWFRYIDGNVLPPLAVMLDFAKLDYFSGKGYEGADFSSLKIETESHEGEITENADGETVSEGGKAPFLTGDSAQFTRDNKRVDEEAIVHFFDKGTADEEATNRETDDESYPDEEAGKGADDKASEGRSTGGAPDFSSILMSMEADNDNMIVHGSSYDVDEEDEDDFGLL